MSTPTDLLRKAIIIIPELKKVAETKDTLESLYIEQSKQSKKWILGFEKMDTRLITTVRRDRW